MCVLFEICVRTDRQTNTLTTILRTPTGDVMMKRETARSCVEVRGSDGFNVWRNASPRSRTRSISRSIHVLQQPTLVAVGARPAVKADSSAVLRTKVVSVVVVARPTDRGAAGAVVVARAHDTVVELKRRRRRGSAVVRRPTRPLAGRVQQVLRGVSPDQSPGTACKKYHHCQVHRAAYAPPRRELKTVSSSYGSVDGGGVLISLSEITEPVGGNSLPQRL